MKALSVILIAHNEEQAIGRMLEGLLANYDSEILEIIVVDDASKDRTAEIVEDWSKRNAKVVLIKRTPPCGVGRALKAGFNRINPKAECVLSVDSDFVENIGQVRALITAFDQQKCDGVIGSRFIKGGKVVGYPFPKLLMNRLFHSVVRTIFRIKQNKRAMPFMIAALAVVLPLVMMFGAGAIVNSLQRATTWHKFISGYALNFGWLHSWALHLWVPEKYGSLQNGEIDLIQTHDALFLFFGVFGQRIPRVIAGVDFTLLFALANIGLFLGLLLHALRTDGAPFKLWPAKLCLARPPSDLAKSNET